MAAALAKLHGRGLIHKDIKPANILVNSATWAVWLTGFGIASHLPRERQTPGSTEAIAGTLAYMAPEQTGRMNRSIDSRSDLYACGITLYETITGSLPFSASDPMEWIHCHIARPPTPPSELTGGIPGPIEAIILKLLAKSPEDRFQTAAGLEADLRTCLTSWVAHRRIDPFPIGARDMPDRLLIPEKLYGRKLAVDALVAAFDRVAAHGRAELILVSGMAVSASPPSLASSANWWCRPKACSRRGNSISTNVTSRMRPWRRRFKVSSVSFLARMRRN
jgi:serine/threonine protein kinase